MENSYASVVVPSLKRRLMSMVYEAILLFAVGFLGAALFEIVVHVLFDAATREAHAQTLEKARGFVLFLLLAWYFIVAWTRSGQTLAMKTWRLQLVVDGQPHVPVRIAALRYVYAYLWFMPGILVAYFAGLHKWEMVGMVAAGVALWSLTAFLDKDRQFLHDKMAGTRLVQLPKPVKAAKTPA